jgi:hypothetical protein
MAELDLAAAEVRESAGQDRSELADGRQAHHLSGVRRLTRRVGDFAPIAHGDGAGGIADEVESSSDGPLARAQYLRRVIEAPGSTCGEEIW